MVKLVSLSGWSYSSDYDKKKRWEEILEWANKYDLLNLTNIEECDMCFESIRINQFSEYLNYTDKIIQQYNLHGFVTLKEYIDNPKLVKDRLPDLKGVYFVIHRYEWPEDMFIFPGTGGHFNGKDPNVNIGELWKNWVEEADILYIGKAGGISSKGKVSNATLKKRIIELLKFGNGKNIGHWGGRYLWQHKDSFEFKIYWYACLDENPVDLELRLIKEFEREYSKKPFANIK